MSERYKIIYDSGDGESTTATAKKTALLTKELLVRSSVIDQ